MHTRQIKLSDIHIDEALFQHRSPEACGHTASLQEARSYQHIIDIAEGIKRGEQPNPLELWQDAAGKLWMIDGHHRYYAYQEAYEEKPNIKVLVNIHKDISKDEAIKLAYERNKHAKLNMQEAEKFQVAWKFICSGAPHYINTPVRTLAAELGISKSTIDNMRKTRGKLIEQEELANNPLWKDAKTALREYERGKQGADWREKQLEKVKGRFLKALREHHGDGDLDMVVDGIKQAFEEMYGIHVTIDLPSKTSSGYDEDFSDF